MRLHNDRWPSVKCIILIMHRIWIASSHRSHHTHAFMQTKIKCSRVQSRVCLHRLPRHIYIYIIYVYCVVACNYLHFFFVVVLFSRLLNFPSMPPILYIGTYVRITIIFFFGWPVHIGCALTAICIGIRHWKEGGGCRRCRSRWTMQWNANGLVSNHKIRFMRIVTCNFMNACDTKLCSRRYVVIVIAVPFIVAYGSVGRAGTRAVSILLKQMHGASLLPRHTIHFLHIRKSCRRSATSIYALCCACKCMGKNVKCTLSTHTHTHTILCRLNWSHLNAHCRRSKLLRCECAHIKNE